MQFSVEREVVMLALEHQCLRRHRQGIRFLFSVDRMRVYGPKKDVCLQVLNGVVKIVDC